MTVNVLNQWLESGSANMYAHWWTQRVLEWADLDYSDTIDDAGNLVREVLGGTVLNLPDDLGGRPAQPRRPLRHQAR